MPVLRKDPVVERWVLFSEARGKRPSDFGGHKIAGGGRAVEDPATCPFEGGREGETPPEVLAYRAAGGAADSPGWSVRVVPNKFPALTTEGEATHTVDGPFQSINGVGAHEVIVETPDHAPTTADLEPVQCAAVLQAFQDRIHAHTKDPRVAYVSIFKNEGRHAGASRAHTHTQLIAMPIVPKTMQEKLAGCRAWLLRDARERPALRFARDRARCPFCGRGTVCPAHSVRDLDRAEATRSTL
jgi:UDPglucose--hexose-1-phosphate uridylyltransferase